MASASSDLNRSFIEYQDTSTEYAPSEYDPTW